MKPRPLPRRKYPERIVRVRGGGYVAKPKLRRRKKGRWR